MTAVPPLNRSARYRVAVLGLGAIGREVLRALAGKRSVQLEAVVDPAFAGHDAGVLAGIGPLGLPVLSTVEEALTEPTDVVVALTTSDTAAMLPVVSAAAARGTHVVSSCEDLAFARLATPELANRIDTIARAAGIVVVGTGVNPGFVMDRLVLTICAACVSVDSVRIERVVDAAKRRAPLRAKVGAGLTVAEFESGVAMRQLGHRGLPESCALVGAGLGFAFDELRSSIEPVVATATAPRAGVETGRVAGLRQRAEGIVGGQAKVVLDLEMSMDAPDPHDRIRVAGDPPLDLIMAGGTHGDRGTIGAVLNAIAGLGHCEPGLRDVGDLPSGARLF
ncbi:MAG TPA: dihydrodipicolinate reductase [Polyangia bacterium]